MVKECCAQDHVEMCGQGLEPQCFAVGGHELDEFGGCGGKKAMAGEFDLSVLIMGNVIRAIARETENKW